MGVGGVMVELKKAKKVCVKKIRQPLKEAREHQKWFSRSIFVLTGKKYRYSIWKLLFRSPFILFYFPELVTTFPVYLVCRRLWLEKAPPPYHIYFLSHKGKCESAPLKSNWFYFRILLHQWTKIERFWFGNPPFWNIFFIAQMDGWRDGWVVIIYHPSISFKLK